MIEKIKYRLKESFFLRRMQYGCVAVFTALAIVAATLLSCSIHTVEIFDGNSVFTVRTLNKNFTNVFSGLRLKSDEYNILKTNTKGSVTSIEIEYTFPVYVTCGNQTTKVNFSKGTVKDALAKVGYTVDEHDFVEPAIDTQINDTIYIDYVNVDFVSSSYTEAIPYETQTVYSATAAKGVTSVKNGTDGVRQVNCTEKFVNGVSVEKNIISSEVLTAPVNAVKTVGTKDVKKAVKTSADVKSVSWLTPSSAIELDAKGNPLNYKSKMTVRATAYTYTGNNCATGVAPKPGYIAVNPKVIPYGTKMYIKTADGSYIYGYAVAADTGGFIKKHPTGVDLFLTSESACVNFGVRNVEIYILE
ncbi:MAG: G5 domain-containing protein [Clostridia bacterium]|nr:G5 domain-containing protein [Clostridia bacterium]